MKQNELILVEERAFWGNGIWTEIKKIIGFSKLGVWAANPSGRETFECPQKGKEWGEKGRGGGGVKRKGWWEIGSRWRGKDERLGKTGTFHARNSLGHILGPSVVQPLWTHDTGREEAEHEIRDEGGRDYGGPWAECSEVQTVSYKKWEAEHP